MKPLHAQISEYIMTKIQSGEWPVGHMLPTELELCEQFGISRSSVRTAMMSLVNDGYLKRVKGKGTFVTNPMRLEDTTIFIESFAEEMHRHGKEISNEIIEFRVMRGEDAVCRAVRAGGTARIWRISPARCPRAGTSRSWRRLWRSRTTGAWNCS